jgi:hypothetical protein
MWLKDQQYRDDGIGDLAKDVIKDKHRPKCSRRKDWIKHLIKMRACDWAIYALHRAFDEYEF